MMEQTEKIRNFSKVIIFGASGFIGSHLKHFLATKYSEIEVIGADILKPNDNSNYQIVDVRRPFDIEGLFGPETLIFNLAAVHRTPGHPDEAYFETNIRGAENVCDFARRHDIQNIVFTSSISPYGAAESLKTEGTLPTPNTPYGISKLVAEKIHQVWQAESPNHALSIVRPGIVFGKGENGNMTRLYKGLKSHKFAYAGRKDTIKAAIYVKDLVQVMMAMAQNENSHLQVHNCCFYPSYDIEKIVKTMLGVTGLKRKVPYIPRKPLMLASYICVLFGGLGLGVCPARVKKLMISTNICGEKLAENYSLQYTLESALKDWWNDCGEQNLE